MEIMGINVTKEGDVEDPDQVVMVANALVPEEFWDEDHRGLGEVVSAMLERGILEEISKLRSEERRVGKEC